MKSTWRNVILVSLILILLELAGAYVFIGPYYRIQCVFNSIDDGQYSKTQKIYEELKDSGKKEVQDNLDGYSAFLCKRYVDGELSYQKLAACFDAINSIDESGQLMSHYMEKVNHNEFKAAIKGRFSALSRFDNNVAYEYNDRITLLQQRMDNDVREMIMIELMNDYYDAFITGTEDGGVVSSFADMVSSMSFGQAYEYSMVIQKNVEFVKNYRYNYDLANNAFMNEDYFTALDICDGVVVDEQDTTYKDMYASLLKNSYNMGKLYYEKLLDKYIDSDDKDSAVLLMGQITEYYGDDFDLSKAKQKLAKPWQLAYVSLVRDIDEVLEGDLYNSEVGQYIYLNEYDKLRPDSVVLHDIDDDKTPEIFLFNSSQVGNSYIGCFIYNYVGSTWNYLGYFNVKSFGRASSLICFPIAFDREAGDEDSLVWYDGVTLSTGNYVQYINGTYYVGGAEVNDVDYLSAKTEILSYADPYNVGNSKYVSLEDAESYILAYENEK